MKGGGTHLLPGVATTTDEIRPCHLLPTDAEHTVTGKPTSSRVKRSRGSAPPLLLPRCDVGAENKAVMPTSSRAWPFFYV